MASFILSYDLRNERDYKPLYNALNELNAIEVLESCWYFRDVRTDVQGLLRHFSRFIDSDDGLWVSQIAQIDGFPQYDGLGLDNTPE